MKHIIFTFLLVISSLPAFALDDFAVNSINAQNIKRIVSEMEIAIPHPSLPQSTQKAWQKEQSEACRSDWEHVNGFLSSKVKANTRLAEFGKEWDSADFVYHYFDPYINLEEGKNGTVYLEDIGLFDIVKNSAPSLKAKKRNGFKYKSIFGNTYSQ